MYNQTVVRRLVKGDDAAFHIMFDDWVERVYAHAYDVLQDGSLAKNAARHAFETAYTRRAELKDARRFDEWLMELASRAVAQAALNRRTLCEKDKESEWERLKEALNISEDKRDAGQCEPDQELEEEWSPIFFTPDDDDAVGPRRERTQPRIPQEFPERERKEKEQPAEIPAPAASKRRSKASSAIAAGCLGVIALALVGGGIYVYLTYLKDGASNPALSGAINAIMGLLAL